MKHMYILLYVFASLVFPQSDRREDKTASKPLKNSRTTTKHSISKANTNRPNNNGNDSNHNKDKTRQRTEPTPT